MIGHESAHGSMTISAFARATGLSPKALRLYAESGLLLPAHVDPLSGYRYYRPDQVLRARRIGLLRRAGMPVARIGVVLGPTSPAAPAGTAEGMTEQSTAEAGAVAVTALMEWWREQEAVVAERRGLVDYLRASLLETAAPEHHVRARTVPDRLLATSTAHVTQADLVPTMQRRRELLRAHLDDSGATRGVEWWVIYHGAVTPDDDGPIEVCVPYEGTPLPARDVALPVERAHREACTPLPAVQCHYPQILHAFDAVERWVARHGTPIGPAREVYPVEWDERPGAGLVVEIVQAFEPDP
jgi:DNA-binding transcriptional MerR regulator